MTIPPPVIKNISPAVWRIAISFALVLFMVLGFLFVLRPRLRMSAEDLEQRVIATIQQEAPRSFLVTGSIDVTATVTVENAKTLLPGILDVELGTARAIVQVPGRAYYGFDVREFDDSRISVRGDTVEIVVPQPKLLSVDSNLEELRVWSDKGWLRSSASRTSAERRATRLIDGALARQAAAHVAGATQPKINTAEAIRKAVTPVLKAAGIEDPVFQFRLSERLLLE